MVVVAAVVGVVEQPIVVDDDGWDVHIEVGLIQIPNGREQIMMRYCCTRYLITRDWWSTGAFVDIWSHLNISTVLVVDRFQNLRPRHV